eukprot:7166164-Prymnesium_polylepis.1
MDENATLTLRTRCLDFWARLVRAPMKSLDPLAVKGSTSARGTEPDTVIVPSTTTVSAPLLYTRVTGNHPGHCTPLPDLPTSWLASELVNARLATVT